MRFLLRPAWLAFTALTRFVVACYTVLAPWQFGREEQREAQEQAIATADHPAGPVGAGGAARAGVTPELRWRQVTVTGSYLADAEAVVRLRAFDGKPAFEVLTPMRTADGRVVAVDRGLAPATDGGAVPVYAAPPTGEVTVTAWLYPDQPDPTTGRSCAARARPSSTRPTPASSRRRPAWSSCPGSSSPAGQPGCWRRCRSARRSPRPRPSRTSPTPCSG